MNTRRVIAVGAVWVLMLAPAALADKVAAPTGIVEQANCVTSQCHADVKNYKALHGPVNVNNCDACHRLVDAKTHHFEIARQKAELCTFCHEIDLKDLKVVHQPVANGECLGCHNPHGGPASSLLRDSSVAQLCGRCHEDVMRGRKFRHGPAASGECTACHGAHGGKYKNLLDAEGTALCVSCHADFESQMAKAKFKHAALDQGCTHCHDAHASNYPSDLVQPAPDLCLACHQQVKTVATSAKYKHDVVLDGKACLTCHTAHGSDQANLMSDTPVRLCMTCHSDPIKMTDGRVIAAVGEISDPAMTKHGPIQEGQCSGCHTAHGSDRASLLTKNFSEAFYQSYSPDDYDLCFSCHDVHLVQQPQAHGLTQFRNGDVNLHYVHVNRATRGRSCRACHATHASKNPKHMRNQVPYGKWQLPINFHKTATGGSCESGCHATYAYDREHPVDNPTTGPAQ